MNLSGRQTLSRGLISAIGLSAIALLSNPQPTQAQQTVVVGSDYWTTPAGSSAFDFGAPLGEVFFEGVPLGMFAGNNVGLADTVVRRLEDANIPMGGSDTIDIEIVALSLVSSNPVDLGGGNFFDIEVGLTAPTVTPNGLTINDDGTFFSNFNVDWTATFVPTGGGPAIPCPIGSCDFTINLSGGGFWDENPGPETLLVPGLVGDLDANFHTNLGPNQTDFFFSSGDPVDHDASGAGHHIVRDACEDGPCEFNPIPEPTSILSLFAAVGLLLGYKKPQTAQE